MKIIGIANKMSKNEIEHDINARNFTSSDLFCTVVHTYTSKKEKNTQKANRGFS